MTRNRLLNLVLKSFWENGICSKSYTELFYKLDSSIKPDQHDAILAKLVVDGHIERTTGFGKNNYEITITDKGIDKIASGGYPDYDESTLEIIDNEKAISRVIELYTKAYSHSLTFNDFFNNHMQRSMDSSKTKQLIISLHKQGILPGLPWGFCA